MTTYSKRAFFAAELFFKAAVILLPSVLLPAGSVQAQTALTVGAQEVYDDNIFLENDKKRAAPFVLDNAIEQDLQDGSLSIVSHKENDGNPDEDFITNLFVGISGDFPEFEKYALTTADARVGVLLFADNSDYDRLTLDGSLDLLASEYIIPKPFYLGLNVSSSSESGTAGVAGGTAAQATQSILTTARTGYEDEILPETMYRLGYLGGYQAYVGALEFGGGNNSEELRFSDEGSDYQTHTALTSIDHKFTDALTLGLAADYGVQLFTNVRSGSDELERDADDLDRHNANAAVTGMYQADEDLSFRGAAGVGWSKLMNDPEPTSTTVIDESGEATTVVLDEDNGGASFIFSGAVNYTMAKISSFELGAAQNLATDISGEQITTRSYFLNNTTKITDRLSVSAGGTYIQFSGGTSLTSATDRWEATGSVNYSITQNTAIVAGYNFIDQQADSSSAIERLQLYTEDYQVNRFFISINTGFVGLPL